MLKMKKMAVLLVASVALYGGTPAFAQDFDDLVRTGNTAQTSRTVELLDEIDAILGQLQSDLGGNFTLQVKKDTPEDIEFSRKFENTNIQIDSLWKQFFSAVNQEVEQKQFQRDQKFQTEVADAFQAYRSIFTGAGDEPSAMFNKFVSRAGAKNLLLRRDIKFWIDKKLSFDSGIRGVSSGGSSPMSWDSSELTYAIGLMPSEMLQDVNKSISTAYFYGYVNKWNELDPTMASSKFGSLGIGSYSLNYNTTLSEDTYYKSIYGNGTYLPTLSNHFKAKAPKGGNAEADVAGMSEQVATIEELLVKAEGFAKMINEREGTDVITTDKGNMYLHRSIDKATAERIMSEYSQLQGQFEQRMNTFKVYLDNYRNNFGGAESLTLQQAMRKSFREYQGDFIYSEIDQYGTRYEALKLRAQAFKLDRRGGLFGATDRKINTPSWGQRPRKELYSAQRLLTLLPSVMISEINDERQQAYRWGSYNAEAEYQSANNYSYGNDWNSSQYSYDTVAGDGVDDGSTIPGEDLDTNAGTGDYGTVSGDNDYSTDPIDNGSASDYSTDYGTEPSTVGTDLSSASSESLQAVHGIGAITAQHIIDAAPFYSWDDLKSINGIGDATAQDLSDAGFRIDGQPYLP